MEETIEEAALKLYPRLINDPYNPAEDDNEEYRNIWIAGAKWQYNLMDGYMNWLLWTNGELLTFEQWFNKYRKK